MNSEELTILKENVASVRGDIEKAKVRVGRTDSVVLLAAVKYTDTEHIKYLHSECGITDIGENRVQQLLSRYDELSGEGLNIHFIGSLQTNKVKYIIDKVCMICSLDSEKLAAEIDRQAKSHGLVMDVLVEINSGGEESKGGICPSDAEKFCNSLARFENIRLCGFMTMAPKCENREDYLKYFSETLQLSLDIWHEKLHNIERPIISMGMSDSYVEAVECGATTVRVGGRLFAGTDGYNK